MSGIYIHIPFCHKACHYCNFHFSTNTTAQQEMVDAIMKEFVMRAQEVREPIETIYFGGGTPSILTIDQLKSILNTIKQYVTVNADAEITLEANPDDLTLEKSKALYQIGINRLSIGIQSFFDEDLIWMNRSHQAQTAELAIQHVKEAGFKNITIDLIYGIPGMNNERWKANLKKAIDYGITHISSYCLTVEEKTALAHFISKGTYVSPNEEQSFEQFEILRAFLQEHQFEQYEISNFARDNKYAIHNTNYWRGKSYIGLGPAAHSYHQDTRSWNIANNMQYIKSINEGVRPFEQEILTPENQFNEYIMTGLRTMWGCDLQPENENIVRLLKQQEQIIAQKISEGLVVLENHHLKLTDKGKFLADGIASDIFV